MKANYAVSILMGIILAGCQPVPVKVLIDPITHATANDYFPNNTLSAGQFVASGEAARPWLELLHGYLQQQLDARQAAVPAGDRPQLVIGGQLGIVHGDFSYQDTRSQLKMELTFDFIDPRQGRTLRSINTTLFTGDPAAIEEQLKKAVDNLMATLFPGNEPVPVTLARGLTRFDADGRKLAAQGDYRRAATAFQMAADARPDDHAALFNCGVMFELLNQPRQALDYYRRASQLAPRVDYYDALRRVQTP